MRILRFTASWCNPCKTLSKLLETIENKPDIEVIDIEQNTEIGVEYGIRSIPVMIKLDENGNIVSRLEGLKAREHLEQWLNG